VDLFPAADPRPARIDIAPGAVLLPRFALPWEDAVRLGLEHIAARAPLRRMQTPGGFTMSVGMTSCGAVGWTTDRRGYRYRAEDPLSGLPWPPLPQPWLELARSAAQVGGFDAFDPDSCLINSYDPGARMSLHQDRNEADIAQPVVSVSFGLPATFLFGGAQREERPQRMPLQHGDVVVWGGPARLFYHGIAPLKAGPPGPFGARRVNLTFRRAL
jgi:alkylated DNA repair protein (DNA oxidative demethylase)